MFRELQDTTWSGSHFRGAPRGSIVRKVRDGVVPRRNLCRGTEFTTGHTWGDAGRILAQVRAGVHGTDHSKKLVGVH